MSHPDDLERVRMGYISWVGHLSGLLHAGELLLWLHDVRNIANYFYGMAIAYANQSCAPLPPSQGWGFIGGFDAI